MTSPSNSSSASRAMLLMKQFFASVWFFPVILAIPLLIFTALEIHGSSIGAYHEILYGKDQDKSLIANQPRGIRSDEWLVNTQKIIAQAENNYPLVNNNLGEGENMSIIIDVPYKEWSVIFKPHNLGFFVMPVDNAFALRWWLMGYLLIVSCYFFVLTLLPKRRLLAAALGLALFFSSFVQWWYVYGTLASMYYPLFIATATIHLWRQKERWKKITLTGVVTYLMVCFALVLYPPFQIACGMVLLVFLLGYVLEHYSKWGKKKALHNIAILLGSGLVAVAIVGAFLFTRLDVVRTTTETAYPGRRSIPSAGVYPLHFMSSHLGYQFTSDARTGHYLIDGKAPSNQSETSNFLLLTPFLFLPSIYLIYRQYRRKKTIDWSLLLLNVLFIIFLLEVFVTEFTPVSRLLLLDKVGGARLLIGLGLLNIMALALLIRNLSRNALVFPRRVLIPYCFVLLGIILAISLHVHNSYGQFLGLKEAILFSVPIPLVIYLLLRKRFLIAVLIYLAFSFFISYRVNPLYKGLSTLTNDPISAAVEEIGSTSNKRWISDGGYLEHMASINGEPSLSGVYDYPQLNLWKDIPGAPINTYNRYAHVGFQLTDSTDIDTSLVLITPDSFVVRTNSCSQQLRQMDVGFVLTSAILEGPCTELKRTMAFPNATLYIYQLK